MFLREMNSVRGLCKKKYSLGTKKPGAFLELEGQRAKIIDPLNTWNEWLAMASSSALEVHGFSLESDFMSHPIKGPQMWSVFTSRPGVRHSHCSENSSNSRSQVPFSALPLSLSCDRGWIACTFSIGQGMEKGNRSPSTETNPHLLKPLPSLLVTTQAPCPFSPDLPWVSGLLLSSSRRGQASREDWKLSHLPGLVPEHCRRTFSEDMVEITELPWDLGFLGKGWPPCVLGWM